MKTIEVYYKKQLLSSFKRSRDNISMKKLHISSTISDMKIEYDSTYIPNYTIMHPNYDYGDYASCVSLGINNPNIKWK